MLLITKINKLTEQLQYLVTHKACYFIKSALQWPMFCVKTRLGSKRNARAYLHTINVTYIFIPYQQCCHLGRTKTDLIDFGKWRIDCMLVLFQACTCGRLSWSNFQEGLVSLSQFILHFKSKLNIIQFKKAYQIFLY